MSPSVAATVAGRPVAVAEVDAREVALRESPQTAALPRPGTSEGRQLRRWLTQLLVTERVVQREAEALGVTVTAAPPDLQAVLPDLTARLEIGSIAAGILADPLARAVYAAVTAGVDVDEATVADYHRRNPHRFAAGAARAPELDEVAPVIADLLRGAARRRAFRLWLEQRRAALVWLAPGYEHPGDPRQPDNTHKH
jgi:[acyl-carrier-protein] S-malonyltransferase